LLGSVIGLFLAWNSLGIIQSHGPADLMRFFRFSQTETLGLDLRVLGFVAMSMALLVGAGAMIRSLLLLQRKDLGFRTDQVVSVKVELGPESESASGRRLGAYQQMAERLRTLLCCARHWRPRR
jgi:hypothetical protein